MIYHAQAYLRLSKEDEGTGDSDSILNQEELIRFYIEGQPDIVLDRVWKDDGYSGVNFQRPGFQGMLRILESGEANCVIVKDLSRFGRNYIEAGYYIDRIFPKWGVRFIAVNDHYDSLNQQQSSDLILVPLKNLMNEIYSRELSIKIRSQFAIKRQKGEYLGAFALYGYEKAADDKHKLKVDPVASQQVRRIYLWYLKGKGIYEIAAILNREQIPSPAAYKAEHNSPFYTGFLKAEQAAWSHTAIRRILKEEQYTGTVVQGRYVSPNYKVQNKKITPPGEWIRVSDRHEAIIQPMVFQRVQSLLAMDMRSQIRQETEREVPLLAGLLKCGTCGGNMVQHRVNYKKQCYCYYVCGNHKYKKISCTMHSIREQKLLSVLQAMLKHMLVSCEGRNIRLILLFLCSQIQVKSKVDLDVHLSIQKRNWQKGEFSWLDKAEIQ